jgi:hypothetical protein
MLASVPASMLNQNRPDLGILYRFDAATRHRIDIEERRMLLVVTIERCHAATSDGAASAKRRRKSAAACALLHAVKKARVSAFRRPIQFSI